MKRAGEWGAFLLRAMKTDFIVDGSVSHVAPAPPAGERGERRRDNGRIGINIYILRSYGDI